MDRKHQCFELCNTYLGIYIQCACVTHNPYTVCPSCSCTFYILIPKSKLFFKKLFVLVLVIIIIDGVFFVCAFFNNHFTGVGSATAGGLTFMVGGEKTSFDQAKSILECMGKNVVHTGGTGTGQAAKICNNMLLAISMIGTSEVLHLSERYVVLISVILLKLKSFIIVWWYLSITALGQFEVG